MGDVDGSDHNIDAIFAEIGEFGLFQILSLFLICIPNTISATFMVNYIFATNNLDHRSVQIIIHTKFSYKIRNETE